MKLFLASAVIGAALACEGSWCANVDMGSCGNACCAMTAQFDEPTETVADAFVAGLQDGGVDGLYTLQMTAEGTLGVADLREYNLTVDFLGQTWHSTATMHYNDTINFKIADNGAGGSTVDLFSISQIAGALGDDGQNAQNIASALDSLDIQYTSLKNADESCPAPSS